MPAVPNLPDIRAGGKRVLAQALAAIESQPFAPATVSLLDEAWSHPHGHVIGITGPPGVGKSTLLNSLVARWRGAGRTVGIIAVDPSSRRSGGALLGDRTRIKTDPEDQGVFLRSMAARDRLGGLADLTRGAVVLMRALYDIVLLETVGVGQSETDVASVADTVVFCIQPASGDSLQFMKAGIMEVPHIVAVTKGDLGAAAARAEADVKGALGLNAGNQAVVVRLSSTTGEGLEHLLQAIDRRWSNLQAGLLADQRRQQGILWLRDMVREEVGKRGLARVADSLHLDAEKGPFSSTAEILDSLPT